MFKITQNLTRFTKKNAGVQGFLRFNNFASAPITVAVKNAESDVSDTSTEQKKATTESNSPVQRPAKLSKAHNALVAAAFVALKTDNPLSDIKTPFTDSRITNASTINELLTISEGNGVSRRHALKVVSILADWSMSGKIELAEFESDVRFIRLCKILTKNNHGSKKSFAGLRSEDLSTIINVTADDEAAKLITSISLPQMVKVMSALALKKRRSTPLLRSLAFNIAGSAEHLDLKQSADLLYSTAVLNFVDVNLLEKVCVDVCMALEEPSKGSAVIGSILTSLGLLRHKDAGSLDALSEWILKNHSTCRPQDIFSLFITLAILNHQPTNAEQIYRVLVPQLNIAEATKLTEWLDVVWSLVVLNQVKPEHISTVLSGDFIKKIEGDVQLSTSSKLKLINIDGACNLLVENYNGPRLAADSHVRNVTISRSKDKDVMVSALQDSLSNLLNPQTHLKCNIDTGMGFYIDAELALDTKCNPLPLDQQEVATDRKKIAVLAYDYHDTCRGRMDPTGINALFSRLLEAQGYRILAVPYTEFNARDKLVNRVKYLETKLKSLAR